MRIGQVERFSGVLCDNKMPMKLKDKFFKSVTKSTMLHDSECLMVGKRTKLWIIASEMKMLRCIVK